MLLLPSNLPAAAFLTQTVTLDDQTTVKFEIWCVRSYVAFYLFMSINRRDTAGQERYKASTLCYDQHTSRADCLFL